MLPSVQWLRQDLRHAPDAFTRVAIVQRAAMGVPGDIVRWVESIRKRVDLWGNDWYLGHVVRGTRWWGGPSHVVVLGDLLGSQWVGEGEFGGRAGRFWGRVMRGLGVVPDNVYGLEDRVEEEMREGEDAEEGGEEAKGEDGKNEEEENYWGGTTEILGADPSWSSRVINIAGNHDIGYAGDIDEDRIERFEKAFGRVNWDIWFTLPRTNTSSSNQEDGISEGREQPVPALRLVILNSMNLDTPAYSPAIQSSTYSFLNHIITTARPVEDRTHATILLTHIPLEKAPGTCVDSPFFSFFDEYPNGIREQNMLSGHSSRSILQGIFGKSADRGAAAGGMGRNGIVLNGHDHEGCDVVHFVRQDGGGECSVWDIDEGDAYWPTSTPSPPIPTHEMSEQQPTSPANPLILSTCPAPTPLPPSTESEPDSPWSTHPFPPLTYHISPDNKSCTHIPSAPQLREITLRSMMGDFGGYAGFLSAWFDTEKGEGGEWVFEFNRCGLGVQHWWWGVHIVDLVFVVALGATLIARVVEGGEVGRRNVNGVVAGKNVAV